MAELDEAGREFLIETNEGLVLIERDLVALEEAPADREPLKRIFRIVHSLKSNAGFLGFAKLESLSHAGESLLSLLRNGELAMTRAITDALLALGDAVRAELASIEKSGHESARSVAPLVERLQRLQHASQGRSEGAAAAAPDDAHELVDLAMEAMAKNNVRVDVGLLDRLMTLVGELVLERNRILQLAATRDAGFLAASQRLNLITNELQEAALKTRMQPLSSIWGKFPRLCRDLANALGKRCHFEAHGAATELDRGLMEAIKDPLTHIVRNAIDHGIEAPEARIQVGKPAEGHLSMRAFHQGSVVVIEVTDDGAGIDPNQIRQLAVARDLLTTERAAQMSDHELIRLIFLPGFSTAKGVSRTSGRGVGMDIVKANIEKAGGSVDVDTAVGHGTTLRLKIPLTLAIIPGLIVRSGGERYVLPQASLRELVRLDDAAVETIDRSLVFRLRGKLLPLVPLERALGGTDTPRPAGEGLNVAVVEANGEAFGLIVDEVLDTEEIVVRPLGPQIRAIRLFAGATILGDGKVALIIDAAGLARYTCVLTDDRKAATQEHARTTGEDEKAREQLLIFKTPDDGRMAIPVSFVVRIEQFPRSTVERTGQHDVVKYRGGIMLLLSVFSLIPERRRAPRVPRAPQAEDAEILHVVVHSVEGRNVGLVVGEILDIEEVVLEAPTPPMRNGVLGCVVLRDRVTELLDVHTIVRMGTAAPDVAHEEANA